MPQDDLTPRMRRALEQIRNGGENYRYGPLSAPTYKPTPVKPEELVPLISGGLLWRTVAALERRGLVRLVPTTERYGRVVAVPQEDTDG